VLTYDWTKHGGQVRTQPDGPFLCKDMTNISLSDYEVLLFLLLQRNPILYT